MNTFYDLVKATPVNFWDNINFSDPIVILGFGLLGISIVLPFIIFIIKVIYKKRKLRENWALSRAVRISWLLGAFVFSAGFILLILKTLNIF